MITNGTWQRERIVGLATVLALAACAHQELPAATSAPEPLKAEAYPKMAPLEEYLMDRDAEIALAKSAAPAPISKDATVLVLTKKGYETAIEGKNGFVCMVDRSWTAPFSSPEFWKAKGRSPVCLNAPAARSALPVSIKRTESGALSCALSKNCTPFMPGICMSATTTENGPSSSIRERARSPLCAVRTLNLRRSERS